MSTLVSPARGTITSRFGPRKALIPGMTTQHRGTDIARAGLAVVAPADGRVVTVAYNLARGHYIIIDHGDGVRTLHQHLASKPDLIVGTRVTAGQRIGTMGRTGNVTGVHLHTEVHVNGTPVNPETWYTNRGVRLGTADKGSLLPKLAVDGSPGPATITALQTFHGTTRDGIVSGQPNSVRAYHPQTHRLSNWKYVRTFRSGSNLARAIQRKFGLKQDGSWGPATNRAIQRHVGVIQDSYLGPISWRAIQKALNDGKW